MRINLIQILVSSYLFFCKWGEEKINRIALHHIWLWKPPQILVIEAIFFSTSDNFLLLKFSIEFIRTGRKATINSLMDAENICETSLSIKWWQKAKFSMIFSLSSILWWLSIFLFTSSKYFWNSSTFLLK